MRLQEGPKGKGTPKDEKILEAEMAWIEEYTGYVPGRAPWDDFWPIRFLIIW